MAFLIAILCVCAFTANVIVGAVGDAPLVGNVAEMLILFAAAIAFSAGILQREAQEKAQQNKDE
ncbi:hypothetical protein [Aestuariivita sp.]|jgi:putative effector of murein hydrolase LrgA (UPF0299 family)|uniref:hypothetical protein n=1 Tax=Aestuariivita sp. TaxID=1872407 RepID=UPI00216E490A|nr:hypothetical protein [Aestuariivita sp.]MCE8009021.1 hypothetical protein [Aestuariivita sp.]